MEKCEKYNSLIKDKTNDRTSYCQINRGECPYNNEGHRIEYKGEVMIICKTGGLVEVISQEDKDLITHSKGKHLPQEH